MQQWPVKQQVSRFLISKREKEAVVEGKPVKRGLHGVFCSSSYLSSGDIGKGWVYRGWEGMQWVGGANFPGKNSVEFADGVKEAAKVRLGNKRSGSSLKDA